MKYILIFLLITFFFNINLLQNFQTSLIQEGDIYAAVWLSKFFCDRFLSSNFHTNELYYPEGVNLINGIDGHLSMFLLCPVTNNLGPIMSVNILYLINFFLAFLSMFLVLRKVTQNRFLSFIAGVLFIFSNFFIEKAQGHIFMTGIWIYPPIIYYLFFKVNKKFLDYFWLNLFTFTSFFLTTQNVAIVSPIYSFGILYNFYLEFKHGSWKIFIIHLSISTLLCLAIFTPFIKIYWEAYHYTKTYQSDIRTVQINGQAVYNNDLLSIFAIPAKAGINQITDSFSETTNYIIANKGTNQIEYIAGSLGILEWLLFIIVFKNVRNKGTISDLNKILLILFSFYLILSFGGVLTIGGYHIFWPLPFELLKDLPIFQMIRTPSRFSIMAFTLLLIFIFTNAPRMKSKIAKTGIVIFILVYIVLFKYQPPFQPIYLTESDRNFSFIHQDPGIVLNLPISHNTEPYYDFLQVLHKQPIIGGYVSYASLTPDFNKSINNSLIISNLYCNNKKILTTFDKNTLSEELKKFDIKYIFVHKYILDTDKDCSTINTYIKNEFYTTLEIHLERSNKRLDILKLE